MTAATLRRRRAKSKRHCRACGKRLHLDHGRALAAAALYAAQHRGQYRPYPCPHSAGWHLATVKDCR